MGNPESPDPGRRRFAAALALSAAAGWAFLATAERLLSRADGYEPAMANAAWMVAALLLAILLVASRMRRASGRAPLLDPRGLAIGGFGAALGAGIYALLLAMAPGFMAAPAVVRVDDGIVTVRHRGRELTYPDAGRSRADALVACGQARSLARVLLLGGGRPELVRELLGRGAVGIDVVDPDGIPEEAIAPHLSDEDRAAGASSRVRRHAIDALDFLEAYRGAPYDLVVISPPEPRSIRAGRWYSLELHRAIASRLGPLGVVLVSLPEAVKAEPELPLARAFVAMQEAYPRNAVAALPGKECRLLASRTPRVIVLEPARAAARCSGRVLPGGGSAPPVSAVEMQPLLAADMVQELTKALSDSAAPETLRSPRLYLEERALGAPGSGRLRLMLGAPVWAFLPALVICLAGGMLAARRTSTAGAPGRFAFGAVAFLTGAASAGALLTVMLLYQALSGTLAMQLPALTAAAAAGMGLGAAATARLAGRMSRAPRMSLTATGFAAIFVLLLVVALANLATPDAVAGPLAALAMAALGFAGGLEVGALAALCPEKEAGRSVPGALVGGLALLGVAAGAALVAVGLLPALGPGVVLLMMLGIKLVELGVVAAGAGRKR